MVCYDLNRGIVFWRIRKKVKKQINSAVLGVSSAAGGDIIETNKPAS